MRVTNSLITNTPGRRDDQHHQIAQPVVTHFRPVTCEAAECREFREGWLTVVAKDSPQYLYIRHQSGRSFSKVNERADGLVEFYAFPGQEFWAGGHNHKQPSGRSPLLIHRSGFGGRRLMEVDEFTDSMNETAYRINSIRERG